MTRDLSKYRTSIGGPDGPAGQFLPESARGDRVRPPKNVLGRLCVTMLRMTIPVWEGCVCVCVTLSRVAMFREGDNVA